MIFRFILVVAFSFMCACRTSQTPDSAAKEMVAQGSIFEVEFEGFVTVRSGFLAASEEEGFNYYYLTEGLFDQDEISSVSQSDEVGSSKNKENIENHLAAILQVRFLVGQLRAGNGATGNIIINRLKILDESPGSEANTREIRYAVQLSMILESAPNTGSLRIHLPKDIDLSGLDRFKEQAPGCFLKTFWDYEDAYTRIYTSFYYFKPNSSECNSTNLQSLTFSTDIELKPKKSNLNQNKYPEYHRIWEDQKLKMLMVFTPGDTLKEKDFGSQAYSETVSQIKAKYGIPLNASEISPNFLENPYRGPTENPLTRMRYRIHNRDHEFVLMLQPSGFEKMKENLALVQAESADADYMSFNGHAGYGAKVAELSEAFKPANLDKFQIFYVNGCSTYSYVNPLNSDVGQRNWDMLLNVVVTQFPFFAEQNMAIIGGLIEQDHYQGILDRVNAVFEAPASLMEQFLFKVKNYHHYNPNIFIKGEEDNTYRPNR